MVKNLRDVVKHNLNQIKRVKKIEEKIYENINNNLKITLPSRSSHLSPVKEKTDETYNNYNYPNVKFQLCQLLPSMYC